MLAWITTINEFCLSLLWGPYMLAFFLFVGVYFTLGTGFFQFRYFRLWIRMTCSSLFRKEKKETGSISQFQTLCTALAATVGTGNITGVATALTLGGPGAIFWMWISAAVGMMTSYAENVLTIVHRYKDKNGQYMGGAMLYMERGLSKKSFAVFFSFFCVLASFGMGNMAQMHSISSALSSSFSVPVFVSCLAGGILIAISISGGIRRIAKVTECLVPAMVLLYFAGSFVCLYLQRNALPAAFLSILQSAFSPRSATGGVLGYGVMKAVRIGVSRGVFSNEAGLGTSAAVHAASSVKEPVMQGMWGIFEVFLDTIVVCTLTALVILTSGLYFPGNTLTGVALTAASYSVSLGPFGEYFISVSTIFFAFATVLGWSYFGEQSAVYLFGNGAKKPYRFLYVVFAMLGTLGPMELIWGISDTFNALLAIPNLLTLLLLSPTVFNETKKFLNGPFGVR